MKKLILTLILLLGIQAISSAQDMRTLFVEAPDSLFPLIPRNLRADCIDFIDAGMKYAVTNKLDGKSTLVELGDDYISLETTAVSSVEMKKLPAGDSFVICVVNTVRAEAADSRVAFFDCAWRRLEGGELFEAPAIRDFFTSQSAADELADICDIYLVSLKLDATDNVLVAEYTMPSYMTADDAGKVLPDLRKIRYVWDGKRFVME